MNQKTLIHQLKTNLGYAFTINDKNQPTKYLSNPPKTTQHCVMLWTPWLDNICSNISIYIEKKGNQYRYHDNQATFKRLVNPNPALTELIKKYCPQPYQFKNKHIISPWVDQNTIVAPTTVYQYLQTLDRIQMRISIQ